jgi:DNA repair protein RecO (recombination protein O)
MPDLSACSVCGTEPKDDCQLDVMNGCLICRKCARGLPSDPAYYAAEGESKILIRLSPSVLAALRYLETAPPSRLFSFSLDEIELSLFSTVCERYLLNHLEHGFSSLEYYKKIKNPQTR